MADDDSENDEDCHHQKKDSYDEGCESAHHHQVKHYFGCLKASEQYGYFMQLDLKEQGRLLTEMRRFARLRRSFEKQEVGTTAEVLLSNVKTSLGEWRKHLPPKVRDAVIANSLIKEPDLPGLPSAEDIEKEVEDLNKKPENDPDLKANIVFYKRSKANTHYVEHTEPRIPDKFPHQKVSVKSLLYEKNEETNPLMMDCGKDILRYVHLPANNMRWLEESQSFPARPVCQLTIRNRKRSHATTKKNDQILIILSRSQARMKDHPEQPCSFTHNSGEIYSMEAAKTCLFIQDI
jgi:hypothetical protein